ncbi:MAG: hypothetical protein L0Y42_00130 [Phycisphaerales bacterium]|nr:hypothetical protein [Phycisphaerales bacterium]
MDRLDTILLEAWNRVGARVRRKRISALKRSRRRFKGVLRRPMREWCLVIRASDTRIARLADWVEERQEEVATEGCTSRCTGETPVPPTPVPPTCGDPIRRGRAHLVTLSGRAIRELCKPIWIDWPGVTLHEAAKMCGREYKTIKNWARQGVFKVDYYREFKFPGDMKERRKPIDEGVSARQRLSMERGRPRVWTPSPMDPNNFTGRAPHAVWGTMWQHLWERLPEDYELVVERVANWRVRKGKQVFRGWEFVCPGRLDESGEYKGCGRRCRYLYGPQTVWTLARAMQSEMDGGEGFDMPPPPEAAPEGPRLVGQWFPGLDDPTHNAGPRSFACKQCWHVRNTCMANYNGWNEFVAQISGGLLYGRDVERPEEICPLKRKRREYKRKPQRREIDRERALKGQRERVAVGEVSAISQFSPR